MESISELKDINIKELCRTCLRVSTKEMTSIFDEIEQVENNENIKTCICDMLANVALIKLDTKKCLPTLICTNCLQLTRLLFNFRKQCNKSEATLFKYLTEEENKVTGPLGIRKSPSRESNIVNKKTVIKESINIEKSLNENKHESIIKNDIHELSNPSISDDILNTSIKLEFVNELIISDTESETEKEDKVIGTLGIEKYPNQDNNVLNKKSVIKESISIENSLNRNDHENIIIKNDVNELSNQSSYDDLLNASIKLELDELIISETETECKETRHFEVNFNKDESVFTCQLCYKSFKAETHYFAHLKLHTQDEDTGGKQFKHGTILTAQTEQCPEDKYVCNVCSEHFKHRRALTTHMKQHAEDKHVCNVCSEHFKQRRALIIHMKQHSEDVHVCNICSKSFQHRRNLNAHLHTHSNEKRFSCKICGKKFKQSGSVTPHMRIHTAQRPFLCSVCGNGFSQASTLKYHMRTHTKEKPYMCNVCGITLSMQSTFLRHMRTHTGERPYKCTECSKAFTTSTLLKMHSITHTGLKPFTCDVCKKSFNRKSTLRVHAKIHTDERPHKCPLCGKSFIQAHCLRSHLRTHK